MKLPGNPQMQQTKRAAGTKMLVPMMNSLTNILKRRMWAYDTTALVNVSMMRSGIVWRNVV